MFIHRLSLALGRTVSDLMQNLTPAELRDWIAFDRQAGLPDIAAQWQRAQGIAMSAAKGGASVDPSDMIPLTAWDQQPATASQIAEVFRGQI